MKPTVKWIVAAAVVVAAAVLAGLIMFNQPAVEETVADHSEPLALQGDSPPTDTPPDEPPPPPVHVATSPPHHPPDVEPEADDALTTTAGHGPLTVHGRVTLSEGGPAAGARVTLIQAPYTGVMGSKFESISETQTDDGGRFRLDGPLERTMVVQAALAGRGRIARYVFSPEERSKISSMASEPQAVEVNLELPPAAVIAGVVQNEAGEPIPGATVSIGMREDGSGFHPVARIMPAGEDGSFRFDDTPPGEARLTAMAEHYLVETMDVTASAESLTIQLKRGGATISGTVFRHPEGTPVEGATVMIRPAQRSLDDVVPGQEYLTTITGPLGEYAFTGMPPDTYRLRADSPDPNLAMYPERALTVDGIAVSENEQRPGVDIVLYEGHTLRGRVTDADTHEPIEGVHVISDRSRKSPALSDADGHYTLSKVFGDIVLMQAEKPGYQIETDELSQFKFRRALTLDQLDVVLDIRMRLTIEVSGHVRTADGEPVEGAKVSFLSRAVNHQVNRSVTDADGAFTIGVTPVSSHIFQVKANDWPVTFSDLIRVNNEPVRGIVIIMQPGATIIGEVVDSLDIPVEGATVSGSYTYSIPESLMNMTTSFDHVQTDAHGRFVLENAPPREVKLTASKKGFRRSPEQTFTPAPGAEMTGVKFVLGEGHYIAGRIVDEDGEPVRSPFITYHQGAERQFGRHSRADDEGVYRIEGLADMPVTVIVIHNEYAQQSFKSNTVDRDDFDITLKRKEFTELAGRVVDIESKEGVPVFEVSSFGPLNVEYDSATPGSFIVRDLTVNTLHKIVIKAPEYAPLTNIIRFEEGEARKEMTFEIGAGGGVTGRLLHPGGEAAAGVGVTAISIVQRVYIPSEPAAAVVSGEDGRFVIRRLEPEKHRLTFRPAAPLAEFSREIEFSRHGEMIDLGDITLWDGGTIRGSLVRAPFNMPIANHTIELASADARSSFSPRSTTTNAAGMFAFTGVPEGKFEVTAAGYNARAKANIAAGSKEVADVSLRVGQASLTVHVKLGSEPAVGFNVALETEHGLAGPKGQTNHEGTVVFDNVAPGVYSGMIDTHTTHQWLVIRFDVELGEADEIERSVTFPIGSITGRVVDAAGQPVVGAEINRERTGEPLERDYTYRPSAHSSNSLADGLFSMENVEPGLYTLTVEKDGMRGEAADVAVPEGGAMPEVTLRLDTPVTPAEPLRLLGHRGE